MQTVEMVMLIVSCFVMLLYFKSHNYEWKECLLAVVCFLPILFFSLNMMTEIVTADEPTYMPAVTDIVAIKNMGGVAEKFINQYKMSQMIIGTMFLCIPQSLKSQMGTSDIWVLYKSIHWIVSFIIVLITVHIFDKYILKGEKRRKLISVAILGALLGLPLSCLLFKVTNYDGLSTYLIILGYIMLWAGIKESKVLMGVLSIVVMGLGVMEKGPDLPYWMLGIVIFTFYQIKELKTVGRKISTAGISVIVAVFASIVSSFCYFGITHLLQGGFYRELLLNDILYSFTGTLGNISFLAELAKTPVWALMLMIMVMVTCAIALEEIMSLISRKVETLDLLLGISVGILSIVVVVGVVAAYLLPVRVSPFLAIEEGCYNQGYAFNSVVNHFGAKTYLGHIMSRFAYVCAVIMANYPSIVIIILGGIAVIFCKKMYDERTLVGALMLGGFFAILFVFVLLDLPTDARYYSVPLIMIVVICAYFCGLYIPSNYIRRIAIIGVFVLYCIEMLLYMPNVKAFSPVWLCHDDEYNKEIRTGVVHAGEVMFWGEEIALGGRKIQNLVEEDGVYAPENITVYSNYGITWPGNPGYQIYKIGKATEGYLFDETAYYLLNKFMLYRDTVPKFIYEVSPVLTIEHKGEVGAWIYRGDQLTDYKEWFEAY